MPVACRLSDPEFRQREATLLAQFKSAVIATEELAEGYAFRVPGDENSMKIIFELMVAERACCPFLTFALVADPNMGPVELRVSGPEGSKEFLETILCKPGEVA